MSDPFVARMAMMLLLGLVVIFLALAMKRSGSEVFRTVPTLGAVAVPTGAAAAHPVALNLLAAAPAVTVPVVAAAPAVAVAAPAVIAPAVAAAPVVAPAVTSPARAAPAAAQPQSASAAPVAVAAPTATLPKKPTCVKSYKVVAGDYWIRIAKRAGVTTKQLLAANNATVKTKLFPGRTVCLPANAVTPATTAAAPAPTAKPSAAPTTTKPAPTTTAAPVTTIPQRTYSATEVESIIRQVWPDDLEEEALRIARRESNLRPTAKNSCCYGLFQINFVPHKRWLAGIGVTSANQLLDPNVNANAAYALYQRAGGWGPWAL
jgi:LysM repeat protein